MSVEVRRAAALKALEEFCVENGIQNRDWKELPGYDDGDGYIMHRILARSDDADWWQPGYRLVSCGYREKIED